MSTARLAKLVLSLQADTAVFISDMKKSADVTQSEVKRMSQSIGQVKADTQSLSKAANALQMSLGGIGKGLAASIGIGTVTQVARLADQYNVLDQRIKTATKATGDYNRVSSELLKISNRNGAALADTVSLFQNVARSAGELGASTSDVLTFTNTLQQLGVIGGSSTEAMSRALQQLSQSMAGGVMRAEEFNSIVENMPELAHRIATGLGITDGKLRQLMLSGKLLSKDVMEVLLKQAPEIAKEFEAMPKSMERAFSSLTNSAGNLASKLDQTLGITKLLAASFDTLAKKADTFSTNLPGAAKITGGALERSRISAQGLGNALGELGKSVIFQQSWREGLAKASEELSKATEAANKATRDSLIPANQESSLDFLKRASAERAKTHGVHGNPLYNAETLKMMEKASKHREADLQSANGLLESMKSQNAQLKAKLGHDDETITKEKALLALSKQTALSTKDKARYSAEINKLAAEHHALVKEETIGREREKLVEHLASLKEKSVELKNQIGGQKELNVLAQAEKDIQDTVKLGKKETVAEQQKLLAAAKEVVELEKQLQRQKVEKKIKEDDRKIGDNFQRDIDNLDRIGASIREQNQALALKLTGQEKYSRLLDLERDYQRDILGLKREEAAAIKEIQNTEEFSDRDKSDQIFKVREAYKGVYQEAEKRQAQARKDVQDYMRLNEQLENQDRLLEEIVNGTGTYKEKLVQLNEALKAGDITQKQWQKTSDQLWKSQKAVNNSIGDSIKQMGTSMTTALLNGTKLTDVFKNMTKSLIVLGAQKIVFEPIGRAMDNMIAKFYGTGQYTPRPVMPTMGAGQTGPAGLTPASGIAYNGPQMSPAAGIASGGLISRALMGGMNFLGSNTAGLASSVPGYAQGFSLLNNLTTGGLNFFRSLGIPGFASGGLARGGQPAMFGEQGPELAIPKQDMHVFTAAQTAGMSGFVQGGGSSGGSGWVTNLSGGGTATPENYLGDWVPQPRRDLISSVGFSPTGSEVLTLMRAIQKEPNNYNKKALNEQLTNALFRREQDWQGLIGEYREFARAANYAGAQKMVNEETAAGRGEGLAAMAGNAILSNAHFSHGIIAQGRIVPPRGNALEDILEAARLTGRMPSKGLLQHLAALDAEAQDDYMPGGAFGISKSIGAGYKSMGMGGQGGGIKVFGYDNAYGGDGRQAAVADLQNAIRDESWANNAHNAAWKQITNHNPFGYGSGAGINGRDTVKFMGDPRKDTNGFNPYFSPPVMAPKLPPSMMPGLGIGPSPGGAHVPTRDELRKEFWNDSAYWSDMIGGNYMPQKGSIADYHRGARERLADFRAQGGRSYSLPAYPAAMGIAEAPPMMRGSLSPSSDVFADQFVAAPSRGNSTTWPYGMRTQSSSFDRWPTDAITAGRINAQMIKSRANGGPLAAGDISWVGERGPELIVSNRPSTVIPNHELKNNRPSLQVIVNNTVSDTTTSTVRETPAGVIIDIAEKAAQQAVDNSLGGVRRKR